MDNINNRIQYCTNCGLGGHVFRNCLSPVTSYGVTFDQGAGTWISTILDSSILTYTQTGLTGGVNYSFKIQAYNKYGPGPFSPTIQVIAG